MNAPRRCMLVLAAALLAASGTVRAEEQQLNIYNWADYIGPNTIAEFERETGIKVVYDTFDSDAALEAKVMAGQSGYDIVTTSTNYFGRQIKAGVYEELDKSKLPNWKNLDPRILEIEARFDPGNAHAMPYLHGTNGFAYNVEMIKARMPDAPVDSLDMLFKPRSSRNSPIAASPFSIRPRMCCNWRSTTSISIRTRPGRRISRRRENCC